MYPNKLFGFFKLFAAKHTFGGLTRAKIDHFPGGESKFANISDQSRQKSKIFYVVKLGPGGCKFMKKQSLKIS